MSEVINHFNLAYRAHLLSGTLEDKNYYISNSTSNFNYSKLNPNITLLTFKNTLTDNKNNSPLEYIADEKVFGYGGDNLGNCYYVYGMPLLYQTNLNTNGRICFKSKIISSITEDQYYFTLYNSNITIKLIFTMGGQLKIDVNGVSKSVMSGMDFFKKAHCIDLNYILTNGRLNYTFNLGNNNIVNGYIDFTSLNSMDTSDFKLLIGANKQKVSITDVDNTTHKKWKNLFNGFISDFMYYSTNSVSVPTLEFEELKSPVISYSSFDVFDRKNQIKTNYKNKNVISKKLDYLKDDKYITPLLSEEKILINSSLDDFNSNLNRKFLYSYEGNYENAPKYKNIYSYEENIEVNGNNSSQVYKRDYEYTEGSNFIKKEIIRKGSIVNGDFIENYRLILDYSYNANNCLSSVKQTLNDGSTITNIFNYSANFPHLLTYHNSNQLVYDGLYLKQIKNYMGQAIKEFGYRGTKLTSYKEPLINKTIIFEYDAQGRRTKKI